MDERRILNWLLRGEEVPANVCLTPRRIFDFLYVHRLIPRLLRRVREGRPTWCTESLLGALRREQARALTLHQRRIGALREISNLWGAFSGDRSAPLIPIKGFSLFALTGDGTHMRLSGDLDLLCEEPERLCELLGQHGFTGDRYGAERSEVGHLRRREVAVEVHRYVRIYTYPAGLKEADLRPDIHPGVWRQNYPPLTWNDVLYPDLRRRSVVSQVAPCTGLHVPAPELSVLLYCAHEFGETLHSPFELPVPVRLGILADVRDLLRHPGFDADLFRRLVRDYGATDAVDCMRSFYQEFFREDPLPLCGEAPSASGEVRLPRQVGFRGGWAALRPLAEEILPIQPGELFDRLGATSVDLTSGPFSGEHDIQAGGVAEPLCRWIDHARSPEPPSLRFQVRETGCSLEVELQLPDLPASHTYRVRADGLWLGRPQVGIDLSRTEAGWKARPQGLAIIEPGTGGVAVSLQIPRPESDLPETDGAMRRVLLAVMQRSESRDFWATDRTVLLPLQVLSPHE